MKTPQWRLVSILWSALLVCQGWIACTSSINADMSNVQEMRRDCGLYHAANSSLDAKPRKVIVFVHGSAGKCRATWGSFVRLISHDETFRRWDLFLFDYEAPFVKGADYYQATGMLKSTLRDLRKQGYEQAYLIGHDWGGIVIQSMIISELQESRSRLSDIDIRAVILLGTPNLLNPDQLGRSSSGIITAVKKWLPSNDQVLELRRNWINYVLAPVKRTTLQIPVSYIAGKDDEIVPMDSVRDLFKDVAVVPGDHVQITQPESVDSPVYALVKARLLEKEEGGLYSPLGEVGRVCNRPVSYQLPQTVADIFLDTIRQECSDFMVKAEHWKQGRMLNDEYFAQVLLKFYQKAAVVFATTNVEEYPGWQDEFGKVILNVHKASVADVTRVFIVDTKESIGCLDMQIMDQHQAAKVKVRVYALSSNDDNPQMNLMAAKRFAIINNGEAIGIASNAKLSDDEYAGGWYLGEETIRKSYSALAGFLLERSIVYDDAFKRAHNHDDCKNAPSPGTRGASAS